MSIATAAQTIGPYWHLIDDKNFADVTRFGAKGDVIVLTGTISDGEGAPVGDACVEIWQSSPPTSASFPGYGRAATDPTGIFRLTTLKPGPVPGRGNTQQAPHIAINILARGIITRLYTRAYFAGEALNATDPLLAMIEEPARRTSLIAKHEGGNVWRLDIVLQGNNETVFIDI